MTKPDSAVKRTRDRLFRTVQLLANEARGISRTELQLRLFQFRYWLLSTYSTPDAFRVGGVIFAQLKLEQHVREYRRKWPGMPSGKLMLLSCATGSMQQVLDDTIRSDTSLDELINTTIDPFGMQEISITDIKQLNSLTRARVRLAKSAPKAQDQNTFASLNRSLKLLYKRPAQSIVGRSTMSQIHRDRQDRESFLLACELCNTDEFDMLQFGQYAESINESRDNIFAKLESGLRIINDDKSFFAKSKFILRLVNNTLYDRLEQAWPNLAPDPVSELPPIPPSEMEDADVSPKDRRPALETKRSSRRQPPRSKNSDLG